jgi:hypothetical protein
MPLYPPQIPRPELGSKAGRRTGKPATKCLSYGTAYASDLHLGGSWFECRLGFCLVFQRPFRRMPGYLEISLDHFLQNIFQFIIQL